MAGNGSQRTVHWEDWGILPYQDALDRQWQRHEIVKSAEADAFLILVQHPKVITLGKHAQSQYLLTSPETLQSKGIELVATDRGGEATAHEPGQLTIYPILPLFRWKLSPKAYVTLLERSVIDTLAEFGIKAHTEDEFPGVWVESRKICALGIRIKEKVSLHGLALNISNSLEVFDHIVPCGIAHRGLSSMRQEMGFEPNWEQVKIAFLRNFSKVFAIEFRT